MRTRAFKNESMKEFDEVHKKNFKQDRAPYGGYPDTGNG
jgi:hypothetical protein